MFKTGICIQSQLFIPRTNFRYPLISYSLLRPSPNGTPIAAEVFEKIVKYLELSSGTHRTSYRGRLRDVDEMVQPRLSSIFGADEKFVVHDWAASDALVSSEWARNIFRFFPLCHFTASDLTLHLVEAYRKDGEAYIFEPNGTAIQYVRPPFVILLNKRDSPVFIVNYLLRLCARRQARTLRTVLSKCHWADIDDPAEFRFPSVVIRMLPLVHPEARELRRQKQNFHIISHCALSPLLKPVDVIRTMNIYNRVYFTDADLMSGFRAVYNSLVEGGIWILGRTVEERRPVRNVVSVFTKSAKGFKLLDCLNGGSDLGNSLKSWGFIDTAK